MKRIFWIALGATAGILVARRLTKAARNLSPESAAGRVAGAVGGLTQAFREFADDVKAGMAERDIELREALGIAENGTATEVDIDRLNHMFDYDYPRGT
jgi:hypothetical protein